MTFRPTTRLRCEPLESRLTPAALIPAAPIPDAAFVVGAGLGQDPYVTVYDSAGAVFARIPTMSFDPTGASGVVPFRGGVTATLADITGDDVLDLVVGAGAGGGPRVQVFDGRTYQLVRDFYVFDPDFRGGVSLAAGRVDNDFNDDIVVGAGPGGGPHVKVFSGRTLDVLHSMYAYDEGFRGGVSVSLVPFFPWIVTGAGPGGGPHVKVFAPEMVYAPVGSDVGAVPTGQLVEVRSFYAFDPSFTGGVNVAAGYLPPIILRSPEPVPLMAEVPGVPPPPPPPLGETFFRRDFFAGIVATQASGGAEVRYFLDNEERWSLSPFGDFGGGLSVAVRGVTTGAQQLIVGAGAGGGPRVSVMSLEMDLDHVLRPSIVLDFYAADEAFRGGVPVG